MSTSPALLQAAAPRGVYAKTEMRRQQIIDVAVPEFTEPGYVGGPLRRIALGARISTAGIMHHFASKEVLLLTAIHSTQHGLPDPFDDDVHQRGFTAALLRYASAALDPVPPSRLLIVIGAEAASPAHPAHDWLRDTNDALRQKRASALQAEQGDTGCDVNLTAAALVATWSGLRVQRLLDPRVDVLPTLQRCIEALVPTPDRTPLTATDERRR